MLGPCKMELINIAVLKEDAEDTVSQLLKLGNFHPVDIRQIEEELKGLSASEMQKEIDDWQKISAALRDASLNLNLIADSKPQNRVFEYSGINDRLKEINEKSAPLISRKQDLQEDIKIKSAMLFRVPVAFPIPFKRDAFHTLLEVFTGRISERNVDLLERSLEGVTTVFYPFRRDEKGVTALLIGLRRDRPYLQKVLSDVGWEKIDFSQDEQVLTEEIQIKLKLQIAKSKQQIAENEADLAAVAVKYADELSEMAAYVRLKKSILEARRYSCITEKTMLLSGWVPVEAKDKVISRIRRMDGCIYIEEKSPEELKIDKEDIPVLLKHSALMKPFELLIESYGIPRYGSVDPTLFTALTFLIMFGAMFGDLGQGLVLCTLGLFLKRSANEKIRQAGALAVYAGSSAALFGLLYGSSFGIEFPSLWVKPMENILGLFKISVMFGIAVISLGVLLNVFTSLRDRNYVKAFFDKAGLISGVIYWSGIALAMKAFLPGAGRISPVYLVLISVCFVILFLKPLFQAFSGRSKEGLFVVFMETVIDMMEIVMGYLANTVSFIRVAAFALAHAGLFMAIFELSRLLKDVGSGVVSLLVIIGGNLLVILLEGMVVAIQSLRLNYYEFYSKFFLNGKRAYKPLTV